MNTEILNHGTYQQIIYRTDDGNHCRTLITDLDGNIIQDELVEYDDDGKLVADVVFAPDHTTIIAKREYTDDGFRDYRLKDDKLTLVQFMVRQWLEPNQKSKKGFYDPQGELVYYDIFERDADENIGMVWTGTFDKHDNCFNFYDDPPPEVIALQSYSDY